MRPKLRVSEGWVPCIPVYAYPASYCEPFSSFSDMPYTPVTVVVNFRTYPTPFGQVVGGYTNVTHTFYYHTVDTQAAEFAAMLAVMEFFRKVEDET